MGERVRGRAGQAALKRRRGMFPLCAHCTARGLVRATTQIDHILALALGGEDVDENCQGLCDLCHAIKTALEQASTGGAANHPDWLERSGARLVLVSGPPCAGKSTLVKATALSGDLVIDLDDIAERLSPGFARRWNAELLNQSIRVRNALLGSLSRMPRSASAFFIVSAPAVEEVEWWISHLQPVQAIRLDPGRGVTMERALQRGPAGVAAVEAWYERARRPWRPEAKRRSRVAFDVDGYPVEDE